MGLYPLRFNPLFQEYLWGGRRLGTDLNKPIGDGPTYAESWEIVDHGDYQSIVKAGDYAGKTLGQLVDENGTELLGAKVVKEINDTSRPDNLVNRFPLLFKFLDANKNLSVQVHPDDKMGATLAKPDLGKTEAWLVMDAQPGAKVYAGLNSGVTRGDLKKAIESNTAESVLHSFEPKAGDCIFIPAGTVHALGEGLLIAEIQQCSNTTFRLYDWGRVDKDGQPRELHIEQGIEATDFSRGPVNAQVPTPIDESTEGIVACDQFKLHRVTLSAERTFATDDSFKMIAVTQGSLSIVNDPCDSPLQRGETCLIPASMESFHVQVHDAAEFMLISPH